MVTDAKLEQFRKQEVPMVFTELGRVMDVNPEFIKHEVPKEVTEVGIVIAVRLVQF
jgi:hypothetical protein